MPNKDVKVNQAGASRESLLANITEVISDRFRAASDQGEAEDYRQRCRDGDPFPLIAYQWPDLRVTDEGEAKFFKGTPMDPLDPCLRLDDWQRDYILKGIFDDAVFEIAIKGNTKAGKGASVALAVNLWFDVHEECKIILTSANYKHAQDNIFGEFSKWRKRMRHPAAGKLLLAGVRDTDQHYVTVSNPDTDEAFSGQHGPNTMFVFDEASAVPTSLYLQCEKQARKIIALSNPRVLSGWFYKMYDLCDDKDRTQEVSATHGKRICITVGGPDCMNVRLKRLEKPFGPLGGIEIRGRTFQPHERIPSWAYAHVKPLIPDQCDYNRWKGIMAGDENNARVYGNGQFPIEDPEKQVILISWLQRHVNAWTQFIDANCFGFDAARSETGDKSVLSGGSDQGLAWQELWQKRDVSYHCEHIVRVVHEKTGIDLREGRNPICVDMDGLGVGVGDQLVSENVWVIEFYGNGKAEVDPHQYRNKRSEAYGLLGRRLDPLDQWDTPWALPDDGELHADLSAPEKETTSSAMAKIQWRLQAKQAVAAKLGRSPDKGDSCVYMYEAVRQYHGITTQRRNFEGRRLVRYPYPTRREPKSPLIEIEKAESPSWLREILDRETSDENRMA